MRKSGIEKYLSSLRGAESSHPFGPDALVYKVMGKMFALVADKPPRLSLKARPADAEVLVSMHESVVPGYHLNKRHWITITLDGELPAAFVKELAEQSYQLVVAGLRRADREKLNAAHSPA